MSIIELLQFPFVIRALSAGLLLGWLLPTLGVFVTLRKQAFLADGVAHASLLGVAIGLVAQQWVLGWAVVVAVLISVAVTYMNKRADISHDSSIGVLYSFLFALAIVLLYLFPQYRSDLTSYLFGSLLGISWLEVGLIGGVVAGVAVALNMLYSKLVYLTFDPLAAQVRGVPVTLFEYALHAVLAVAIIVAVKLVGVVLVTGLLVIPSVTTRLFARSFKQMLTLAGAFGVLAVLLGVLISFAANVPTGATIVLAAGCLFGVGLVFKKI